MSTTMTFYCKAPSVMRCAPVAAAVAVALLLTACGQKSDAPRAAAPSPEASAAAETAQQIRIDPAMASRFQVAAAAMADLVPFQEVPGRIEANERLVTRIGASVTGRVTEVLVEVGDRVRNGQSLANVASPELTQAQMAYLRAHSNAGLADRAVDRARQLFQADVIGAAELQRRESELSVRAPNCVPRAISCVCWAFRSQPLISCASAVPCNRMRQCWRPSLVW